MIILDICSNPYTLKVFKIIRIAIKIIKIAVPIMLILSIMIDLLKEITNKTNNFSGISNSIFKRVLAAILIFFIPTIIGMIVSSGGFNTNSYLSCLKNSTNENIDAAQTKYAINYFENSIYDLSDGNYLLIKNELSKISDTSVRKEKLDELEKLKKEYDKVRAENEKKQEEKNNPGSPRPSDESANETINRYVQEAYKIANNDAHGYCNTVGCSQGNMFNPDIDCGIFVSVSLQFANVVPIGTIYEPWDMNIIMGILGPYGFESYRYDENALQYGDILIRDLKHTEIYVGNKQTIGAHNNAGHPEPGDQTGTEVSVRGLGKSWDYIIRYHGK